MITNNSNEDNFEFEARLDDGVVLTFIRSRRTDGGGKIQVRNTLTGSRREYCFFQIPKKYQPIIAQMKQKFGYPDKIMPDPLFLSHMDWRAFNVQREILNSMIDIHRPPSGTEKAVIVGILALADDIVNYATDHLDAPPPSPDARFKIETYDGLYIDSAETQSEAEAQAGRLKADFGIQCRVRLP